MTEQRTPNVIVRALDPAVVLLVKGLIAMSRMRARDPGRSLTNILRPDPLENVRTRSWQSVLETWSPEKRVACFVAVLIGIAIGGTILWHGLRE